jgi:hypothetical protein
MPNHSTSNDPECRSSQPRGTPKSSTKTTKSYQKGYQQALNDFAINELLKQLKSYSDTDFDSTWVALEEREAENLAAALIQTLSSNLNGQLLASHLEAIRHKKSEAFSHPSNLKLPPPSMSLPTNFPDVETPLFLYGDRLRWLSDGQATDWGTVIGRFYSFAPHRCRWRWCYLIWLDPNSPSSSWIMADIAWEEDLEPMQPEKAQ